MTENRYPRLRDNVDIRPIVQDGRPCLVLRDPLQLSGKTLLVPQPLGLVLALCDGTRESAGAVSASLAVRHGIRISPGVVEQLLAALDDALLLDNDAFAQAHSQALVEYRQAPFRSPNGAGQSYPADVDELRRQLSEYLAAVDDAGDSPAEGRGLVSPHIDYARGGPVYARAWKRAADMVKAADLAVILGTDHFGAEGRLTLTRQNYATPFGVLPTARGVVDALAEAMGADEALAGELHHRGEHSIELAAIWLHYIREERPCEIVPILCGSFSPFIRGRADPAGDPALRALVETFWKAAAGRRTIVVAAGDLSHVGPAFGGQPLDWAARARLQAADDELIERTCAGDAPGLLEAVKRVEDRNNVCGLPPIYVALRLLGPVRGERAGYERCPADEAGTSLVSVCGVVFR